MSPLLLKPFDLIKKRRSSRSFSPTPLSVGDLHKLQDFLNGMNPGNLPLLNSFNQTPALHLINTSDLRSPSIDSFKTFKNTSSILFGSIPESRESYLIIGYILEFAVLKATGLHIKSCWLGYFKDQLLNNFMRKGDFIPAIIALGYPHKHTLRDNLIQFAARSSKRGDWTELFFEGDLNHPLVKNSDHPLFLPLECVRLAPSSGNTQPWRIVLNQSGSVVHFYKKTVKKTYEKIGLHLVDMGIALCHFELGIQEYGMKGKWGKSVHKHLSELEYIISFTIN